MLEGKDREVASLLLELEAVRIASAEEARRAADGFSLVFSEKVI